MKRITAALIAVSIGAGILVVAPARAQTVSTPAASSALDPAMQRLLMTLATSLLANFAASATHGSLEEFDPGPAIESALKSALGSRDLTAALDRLIDQVGRGVDAGPGASDSAGTVVSPEMRAMLKAALSGVVAMARSEIAREFANSSGSASAP